MSRYEEILAELRRKILSGQFPVGSSLPPERELARKLGVSRNTLRSALDRLAAMRLIARQQGRGTRVLPRIPGHRIAILFGRYSRRRSAELLAILDGVFDAVAQLDLSATYLPISNGPAGLLVPGQSSLSMDQLAERIVRDYVGAVVFEWEPGRELARLLHEQGFPVVYANLEAPGNLPCTRVDHQKLGEAAGGQLRQLGYRSACVLAGSRQRALFASLSKGLEEALPDGVAWVDSGASEGAAMQALDQYLSASVLPAAIFVYGEERTRGVLRELARRGLSCPEDLSLLAYGVISEDLHGFLACILEPAMEMGKWAVEDLVRRMEGDAVDQERILVPVICPGRSLRPLPEGG